MALNQNTVGIILATYNGEKYLQAQLDSICNQDFSSWHLYVRDDGSQDKTLQILEKKYYEIPDKMTIVTSTLGNCGVIGNFSELLSQTKEQYILFSDQDDVWKPNKISISLEKMKLLERQFGCHLPLLVHTDLTIVNEHLQVIHPSFKQFARLNFRLFTSLNRLLVQNVVTGCTMLINRPLADLSMPIPKDVVMHDWWIALCAAAFGQIGWIDGSTIYYRQHGKNSVGAKPYALKSYLKRWWKGDVKQDKRQEQANLFYDRFNDKLDSNQKQLLSGFKQYCEGSFFEKRQSIVKYQFYRSGLLRKLYDWICRFS